MKTSFTLALTAGAALALAAHSAAAQQSSTPPPPATPTPTATATVSTPSVTVRVPRVKLDKYRGRVLTFNIATMIVQSTDNPRMIWSFQYSTELRAKVADMLSTASFQPGDKVVVYCNPGTTVAVKFKGKPSKPA